MQAIAPANAITVDTMLLRQIELDLRTWHWANTKTAKNRSTAPQPLELPGEKEANEQKVKREERNAQEVAELLGLTL